MEKEVGERIVSISLFALKESLSRWAVLFSSTSLSLLAVVNWVGRGGGGGGGGKRKVLKLLCQIERERLTEPKRGRASTCVCSTTAAATSLN